jgi:hypothetical protein
VLRNFVRDASLPFGDQEVPKRESAQPLHSAEMLVPQIPAPRAKS